MPGTIPSISTRRFRASASSCSARIADKYVRRGKPYLVVEATATDEDGRLIEISRLIGLARQVGLLAHGELVRKWEK